MESTSGRLKADVVVAATYQYYEKLKLRAKGMTFWTFPNQQQIINYPKLHYENGANKNSDRRTHGCYKPAVRVYKNARNRITEKKSFLRGRFPSYFIECLLYNVPDNKFGGTYQAKFLNTLNWLNTELRSERGTKFVCQNEMTYLFGDASVQWNITDACEFVMQLLDLWNSW